jgi:hypothetical protein
MSLFIIFYNEIKLAFIASFLLEKGGCFNGNSTRTSSKNLQNSEA